MAVRLTAALDDPFDALHDVAVRLESFKGPRGRNELKPDGVWGRPLAVSRWRGSVATPPEDYHPMQVEICTGSLSQVGSRLLFRGYGLDRETLPTAAALTACDSNICLDEVHKPNVFVETVTAINDRRARTGDTMGPSARVIVLTANTQ